jgi:four helix bundle protein
MSAVFKNYQEWLMSIPLTLSQDSLWQVEVYRLGLFAADLAWADSERLGRDSRAWGLVRQLIEAVGSVPANVSEGYSRGHQKDRARFYEFALGSAREARTWYFVQRLLLSQSVVAHRMELLTSIVKLLLTMIPRERGYVLHEDPSGFGDEPTNLDALLNAVPLLEDANTHHAPRIKSPHAPA